jgi:hypothetical protein
MLQCALGKEWDLTVEPAIKTFVPIYDALKSEKKKVVVIAHSQGTIIIAKVLELLNKITRPQVPVPIETKAGLVPTPPEELAMALEHVPAPPEFIYPDEMEIKLSDFDPLTENELAKLEIYCFANCANYMKYFRPPAGLLAPTPWIENFGNQYDIVARLGMLAPDPKNWGIDLDGPCYKREGAWGHLLNEHYLFAIDRCQRCGYRKGGAGGSLPYTLINADRFDSRSTPRLFDYLNGGTS